jgi:glycosyltransferase involved in cell wall biosynthesis
MTRKIFAELDRRPEVEVRPICWIDLGNCYSNLGEREVGFLTRPFEMRSRAMARPERRGRDSFTEFCRLISRRRINLEEEIGADDVFLVPDVYRDRRCKALPDFIRRTRARTAAIFHDAADLRLTSVYGDREKKSRPYVESLALFDLVICVSKETRDDLHYFWKKYGCNPTATCVESWPGEFVGEADSFSYSRSARSPHEKTLRQLPDYRTPKLQNDLVLYVSSFRARKNHLTLLHAAEKLWHQGLTFKLHLIGRNAGTVLNKIVRQIWKLQMRGRPVRWLRHVNEQTLLCTYHDCRFTVYPSLMEGFGLPIVESLAHGKPCVCGGNGALGEIARGGGCLIVDQTNEDTLAAGIRKLLTDQETYARLCVEARARKFRTWSDYVEKLLEHLQLSPRQTSAPAVFEA